MQADSLAVLGLMLGFLGMVGVGLWVELDDETQAELARAKGRVLAGAGAAGAVLYLLLSN
jgi:hypothetical protein